MSGDSTHTLTIEMLAKDFASKAMERVGDKGEEVGRRTAKGMKDAKAATDKAKGGLFEFGEAGKRMAGFAGTSFAAMGASVSLATANMDSLAGSSAAAAGSIAAGFGSGGPVGGAIAIASAAVGALIFAFRQSGEEAKKAAEEAAKALEPLAAQAKATAEAIDKIGKEADLERRIGAAKAAGKLDEVGEAIVRVRHKYNEMGREATAQYNATAQAANELARALSNDELDEDVRSQLAKQHEEAISNMERLRSALGTLNEARRDEIRTIEQAREAEQRRAEASRMESDRKEAEARSKAYRDQLQSLREQVGLRVRLAGLDEASRAVDADRGMVMDLRLKGLNREADALEALANKEEARLRLVKQQAEEERNRVKAQAAERRVSNEGFTIKMLQARTEAEKLAVRHAKERADFTGTEAERAAVILRQRAEMVDLARRAKEEAIKEQEARDKGTAEYLEGLRKGNELLRATLDGREKEYQIVVALHEAAEKGGRAAVDALKEQLRLQAQVTEESKKQAEEKRKEAAFQSNLERMIAGGTMDKGLARRRNERRARNRLRKYARAGQLDDEGNYVGGGIRNANAGGAIWAGGTGTGLGAPTQLSGGQGDMGLGGKKPGEMTPAEVAAANAKKDADLGLPDLDALGADALKGEGVDKVLTGLKDAAQRVAEQYQAALAALKEQETVLGSVTDATNEQVKAIEAAKKEAEAIHEAITEANKEQVEMTTAQRDTAEAMRDAVRVLREMKANVEQLNREVQQMKDAASLKGGG